VGQGTCRREGEAGAGLREGVEEVGLRLREGEEAGEGGKAGGGVAVRRLAEHRPLRGAPLRARWGFPHRAPPVFPPVFQPVLPEERPQPVFSLAPLRGGGGQQRWVRAGFA
jgi:hypothetical protein